MASVFKKIHEKAERAGIKPWTKKSKTWFFRTLKGLKNITPRKLQNDELTVLRKKPLVGRMFMFAYDPKTKESLPYYDRFPLILMVKPAKGGFFGLNLHYLPPRVRALFFDKLTEFMTNKRYNENTRIRLSYELLNAGANLSEFAPCFKRYLYSHMKSPAIEIAAPEWEIALFLPVEDFVKGGKTRVWKDSIKFL